MGSAASIRTNRHHPNRQSTDPGAAENPGAGSPHQPARARKGHSKKGYGSLDDGQVHSYALIGRLREQAPITLICCVFDVPTSCFYDYLARKQTINRERMQQRSELRRLFKESRNSAGSRALMSMMRELGHQIGRFKVRSLMKEAGLVSKQPSVHRYQVARSERPEIPNLLAREFDVQQPNQVWCGDITYVWAAGRWYYLAGVLDLYTRRVVGWAMSDKPDAELAIKALEMAYQQRGRPSGVLFHSKSNNVRVSFHHPTCCFLVR